MRQRFLHAVKELCRRPPTGSPPRTRAANSPWSPPSRCRPARRVIGAVARASIEADTKRAEFAILVSHYMADMGLGRHMMGRLVRWAKAKRLEQLYGDVLDSNQPMLSLVHSLGFTRDHSRRARAGAGGTEPEASGRRRAGARTVA
jgi:RimJ/RimL family protein N-acetyltransferase